MVKENRTSDRGGVREMAVKNFVGFILLSIVACTLASCSHNVHDEIFAHLDAALEIEQEFIESQEKLNELEERDMEIYDALMELDAVDEGRLQSLTDEALQNVSERMKLLEEERNSIIQSKEEFQKIEPLIEEVEKDAIKEKLENLFQTMMERYEAYDEVYETYVESLYLTENLYNHLKNEAAYTVLYETLEEVNRSYEKLFKANDKFNVLTKQYNRLKQEYYDMMGE